MSMETKPTNPKDLIGSDKIPLHLWPETATVLGSLGLLDGMLKYGRTNWRVAGVRATIYSDAAKRHINRWLEGRDIDPESGLPELAHALACLAIVVDAQASGMLNDDRQVKGGYHKLIDEMTPHVKRLKELHASKSPKHYTIEDSAAEGNLAEPQPGVVVTDAEMRAMTSTGLAAYVKAHHPAALPYRMATYGGPGAANAERHGGSPK